MKVYIPVLFTAEPRTEQAASADMFDVYMSSSAAIRCADDWVGSLPKSSIVTWQRCVEPNDKYDLPRWLGIDQLGKMQFELYIAVRELRGSPLEALADCAEDDKSDDKA